MSIKTFKTNIYSKKLFLYISEPYFTSPHNDPLCLGFVISVHELYSPYVYLAAASHLSPYTAVYKSSLLKHFPARNSFYLVKRWKSLETRSGLWNEWLKISHPNSSSMFWVGAAVFSLSWSSRILRERIPHYLFWRLAVIFIVSHNTYIDHSALCHEIHQGETLMIPKKLLPGCSDTISPSNKRYMCGKGICNSTCLPWLCHSLHSSSHLWWIMGVPVKFHCAHLFIHYWTFNTTSSHFFFSLLYFQPLIDCKFSVASTSEHSSIY